MRGGSGGSESDVAESDEDEGYTSFPEHDEEEEEHCGCQRIVM